MVLIQKTMPQGEEGFRRLGIVVGAANIEPDFVREAYLDVVAAVDQHIHQVGKIDPFARLEQIEHRAVEYVDSHRHIVVQRRLFTVIGNMQAAVELDHAQIDLRIAAMTGDRHFGAVFLVVFEEVVVSQSSQHVSIHHQKGLWKVVDERQRAHGAQRRLLARVVDVDIPLGSVTEVGHQQLGQMSYGKGDVLKSRSLQLPDNDLQHGNIANRRQRLWKTHGIGRKTPPLAAGQNNRSHTISPQARRSAIRFSLRLSLSVENLLLGPLRVVRVESAQACCLQEQQAEVQRVQEEIPLPEPPRLFQQSKGPFESCAAAETPAPAARRRRESRRRPPPPTTALPKRRGTRRPKLLGADNLIPQR